MSGLLIVVSAPSGAGKTSLVGALVGRDPLLEVSISHTTRPRRPAEADGRDYYFVDRTTFEAMAAGGEFLEHAASFGYAYGTSRAKVVEALETGRDIVLEIDWQGAAQIRKRFERAIDVFVLPPSRATLRRRLEARGQDGADVIDRRMRQAVDDISHCAEFDYAIVNDDFDDAVAALAGIVDAERHGRRAEAPDLTGLLEALLRP